MKKYLVTIEFPPSDNCYHGAVDWIEVYARSEKEARYKARLKSMHLIKANKIKDITSR